MLLADHADSPMAEIIGDGRAEVMTEIGEGGSDIHINAGSQLRLECKLRYATEVPTFAFW